MSSDQPAPTPLEQHLIEKVRASPGCLDGQLVNFRGDPYVQATHGDNPLEAGFSYCVSARPPYRPVLEEMVFRINAYDLVGMNACLFVIIVAHAVLKPFL